MRTAKKWLPAWTEQPPPSGKHRDDLWQELVYRHTPFRPAEVDDFQRLLRQSSALERLFLETPSLEGYYCECMGTPAGDRHVEVDASRHVAAMQLQLMQDVFYSLRLDQYANAPDNRGWMNTFRRWGRSPAFRNHVDELEDTFTRAFISFFRFYIEGWNKDCPVPHRWDVRLAQDGKTKYADLTKDSLKRCEDSNGPGVFLDPGRRDAGRDTSDRPKKGQQGDTGLLGEQSPPEAPPAAAPPDPPPSDNPNR